MKTIKVNRSLITSLKELKLQRNCKTSTAPAVYYDYCLIEEVLKNNGGN